MYSILAVTVCHIGIKMYSVLFCFTRIICFMENVRTKTKMYFLKIFLAKESIYILYFFEDENDHSAYYRIYYIIQRFNFLFYNVPR